MYVVQQVIEVCRRCDTVNDLGYRTSLGFEAFWPRNIASEADNVVGTRLRVKYLRRRDRHRKAAAVLTQTIRFEALGIAALLKQPRKQLLENLLVSGKDADRLSDQFLAAITGKPRSNAGCGEWSSTIHSQRSIPLDRMRCASS